MESVGIREFREKLATYVLGAESPLAITRHGDTIGYFLPARRKRTEEEIAGFLEAAERWHRILQGAGVMEEDAIADFKKWRSEQSK